MIEAALPALWLSLKVAFWATAMNAVLAIWLAYLFARRSFPGRALGDALLTLPMVLPPTVLGYYLLVFLGRNGPVGRTLQDTLGINLIFTWQGAVIAAAIVSFPLVFKSALAAFEDLDPRFEDISKSLGLSPLQTFARVSLPLASRGITAGLLLSFARSMGEFGATLMVAGSIPGQTQTLAIAVYEAVQAGQDHTALILALIVSVVSVCVLLAAGMLARRRLTHSGAQ